jgi:hypothetical protein
MNQTDLKAGDRVILTETVQDLTEGMTGTVVNHKRTMHEFFIGVPETILAVEFDERQSYSVSRMKEGKAVTVVSLCKRIEQ